MRVLFVVYRDFKNPAAVGGDLYHWELARGLSELGNKVTILCSSFEGSKAEEVVDGVRIIRKKGIWSLPLKFLYAYIRKLGFNCDVVVEEAFGGQRFPFFCTFYVKKPLAAVWHQRHDKIFREQYPFFLAQALSFLEWGLAALYRKRTIVTPSSGAKRKLMPLGFKSDNIEVVHDGVGEMFRDVKLNSEREETIVCLGKMRRYKRIDHAVLGFGIALKSTVKPCRLVVAGKVSEIDRGYVDELRRLAERNGVGKQVEFMINISEEEKLTLLKNARILVQPSPVEGFSIVVAEANRCGTPVVVSDGVPFDVVRDGHNGFVYPYGDINAFACRIVDLLNNEETWKEMSKNAYEWSKQFTWECSSLKLEKILKNLVLKK